MKLIKVLKRYENLNGVISLKVTMKSPINFGLSVNKSKKNYIKSTSQILFVIFFKNAYDILDFWCQFITYAFVT